MIGSAVLNTVVGAGIKIGCNLINNWLEQKKQTQLLIAARDKQTMDALLSNQEKQASDPFVQMTRRVLFLMITCTLCYMMIFYSLNPHIQYDIIMPIKDTTSLGIISWIFGAKEFEVVKLTGGLLLMSFMDLAFMVIGFYAVPSNRR
jgi:hypothetical protein